MHSRKKVMLSDEFEYVRSAETEEEWKSFPGLSVGGIPVR